MLFCLHCFESITSLEFITFLGGVFLKIECTALINSFKGKYSFVNSCTVGPREKSYRAWQLLICIIYGIKILPLKLIAFTNCFYAASVYLFASGISFHPTCGYFVLEAGYIRRSCNHFRRIRGYFLPVCVYFLVKAI